MAIRKRIEPFRYRMPRIESREYKIFKKDERLSSVPRTFYEKACRFSNKILDIQPDEKSKKKIQEHIN